MSLGDETGWNSDLEIEIDAKDYVVGQRSVNAASTTTGSRF